MRSTPGSPRCGAYETNTPSTGGEAKTRDPIWSRPDLKRWRLHHPERTGLVLLDDAVAFCASYIRRSVRQQLSEHDREDLLQELLVACWRAAKTYDPDRGVKFTSYATGALSHAAVEWERRTHKRTRWVFKTHVYERQLPTFVELADEHGALAAPGVDPAERVVADSEWVEPGGGISPAAYLPPGRRSARGRARQPPADEAEGDAGSERAT